MSGIYDYLDKWTATAITQNVLKTVRSDVDKREGSIIYDAVAPLSFMVAAALQMLKTALANTDLQTATGEWLDLLGADKGVYRKQAIPSRRIAVASPVDAPLGVSARFETRAGLGLFWTIIEATENQGEYIVECETPGKDGGADYGELSAVTPITGLESFTFTETMVYGSDIESDTDFRLRIWESLTNDAYGGNFSDYKNWVFNTFMSSEHGFEIDGMMFYPSSGYHGGGTVKIFPTITDYDLNGNAVRYMPASTYVCTALKGYLDPANESGLGAGRVPVGHRVTVEPPTTLVLEVSVTVELKRSQSSITDELKRAAYDDMMAYIESVRKDSLTMFDSEFPHDGYDVSITRGGVDNAIMGLGAGLSTRFEQVMSVSINGEAITENNKLEWHQIAESSMLPVMCDYSHFSLVGIHNA